MEVFKFDGPANSFKLARINWIIMFALSNFANNSGSKMKSEKKK